MSNIERAKWVVTLLLVNACGQPSTVVDDRATLGAQRSAQQPAAAGICAWSIYQPPAGCYVDPSVVTVLESASELNALLRPAPGAKCESTIDFTRERIAVFKVAGLEYHRGPLGAEFVQEVLCEPVRVVVSVDAWCGGTERAGAWLLIRVPAGEGSVELINNGTQGCNYGDGNPPA